MPLGRGVHSAVAPGRHQAATQQGVKRVGGSSLRTQLNLLLADCVELEGAVRDVLILSHGNDFILLPVVKSSPLWEMPSQPLWIGLTTHQTSNNTSN